MMTSYLNLNKEVIMRILGCPPESLVRVQAEREYSQIIGQLSSIREVLKLYRFIKHPGWKLPGTEDCTHLACCLISVGTEASNLSSQLFEQGDYFRALMVNTIADEALFSAAEELYSEICNEAEAMSVGLTRRIVPGENGVPLELVREILLQFQSSANDVACNSSYMLQPTKSLVYLYGAGPGLNKVEDHECSHCNKSACSHRRYTITIENLTQQKVYAAAGQSVLSALQARSVPIDAACGNGGCKRCWFELTSGQISYEGSIVGPGRYLACLSVPVTDCSIRIPFKEYCHLPLNHISVQKKPDSVKLIQVSPVALNKFNLHTPLGAAAGSEELVDVAVYKGKVIDVAGASIKHYGIAIDLGTTTIHAGLVDMLAGNVVSATSILNSQFAYGTDVTARLGSAVKGKQDLLIACVQKDLQMVVEAVCKRAEVSSARIIAMTLVANPAMIHILQGWDCSRLAIAPFSLAVEGAIRIDAASILGNDLLDCDVDILPAIGPFAGGDLMAGLLACDFDSLEEPALLVDLGTNAEIALKYRDKIYCASAAAGPAFEGGLIRHGSGLVSGAIVSVRANGGFVSKTVDGKPATGIAGSAIIDIVAELVRRGQVSENGYLDTRVEIAPEIWVYPEDVRQVQLAKAAIRAGIEILFRVSGCSAKAVKTSYLAGGLGQGINLANAAAIGLFPPELRQCIQAVGNSALSGAINYLLYSDSDSRVAQLSSIACYYSLAGDDKFEDLFIEYMSLKSS